MEKIFYTKTSNYSSSEEAVKTLLTRFFGVKEPIILRTETGKPFLRQSEHSPLFFSVSHTQDLLFIAIADENVGVDAECLSRTVAFPAIVKKFTEAERSEIATKEDFLRHWTVKESAVKWLGGTLAHDLYKLCYARGNVFYGEIALPVQICTRIFENHVLTVCSEADFESAEWIAF